MSGPKSYSVKIFDKELVHIFQLQCEVEDILSNLKSYQDDDKKPDAQLRPFLLSIRKECSIALKTFSLGTTAHTIAGTTKAGYDKRIQIKKDQLTRLVNKLQQKESTVSEGKTTKNDYLSYEVSFIALSEELNVLRLSMINYLKGLSKKNNHIQLDKYLLELDNKQLNLLKERFSFFFNKEKAINQLIFSEKEHRKNITKIREKAETKIREVKTATPPAQIKKETPNIKKPEKKTQLFVEPEKELQNIKEQENLTEITALIRYKIIQVKSVKKQTDFSKEFKQIKTLAEKGQSLFILQQLLREVNQYLNAQIPKEKLNASYLDISNTTPHPTLIKEYQAASKDMMQILKNPDARDGEIQHILERAKTFLIVNRKRMQQDRIRQKERAFIKQQLIQALEERKYKVVDDTKVVDFEKQSDFLLKVPGKENYVGVELKENDTLSYVFYSNNDHEAVAKMSIEERTKKVKDMDSSCDDFYNIMKELDSLGISNKIRKPRKAKENYLQGLPEKYQNQIKKDSHAPSSKKRKNDKKRYLDS
ncbi:MAG: hypothetical protein ACI94Y_003360 [Maribacter sp.]|jgi:hypothetical protein